MSRNILITGASGLIGTRLTELLQQQGHPVSHLSRSAEGSKVKTFVWDVKKQTIDETAFNGVDTIIHLAGAGVADKRWTEERKREILESRTLSSRLLFNELKKRTHAVKTVVSASAIGYYGFDDNEKLFKENDLAGTDYLANVVRQWETEVDNIATLGIRVVKIRIGIVLSKHGGVLKEVAKPVKLFAGAPLGSGEQNISWIHIDDLANMFVMAVNNAALEGAYNGTGPYAVNNRVLTNVIAKALHRPVLFPAVPGFILRLFLGEMADIVLKGSKVSSEKIQSAGFSFQFDTLEKAINNLLSR